MAKVYSKVNWGTNTQASVQSLDKMDIGIDAIDTKTKNLPTNGESEDFTGSCTYNSSVLTNLSAKRYGNVVYIRFNYKPTASGWGGAFLQLPINYRPTTETNGIITETSGVDMSAQRTIVMPPSGSITSYNSTVPENPMIVSMTYII